MNGLTPDDPEFNWQEVSQVLWDTYGIRRESKQLNERYSNYLRPGLKKGPFSSAELLELLQLVEVYGPVALTQH